MPPLLRNNVRYLDLDSNRHDYDRQSNSNNNSPSSESDSSNSRRSMRMRPFRFLRNSFVGRNNNNSNNANKKRARGNFSVIFSTSNNTIHYVPSIADYSDKEIKAYWYTEADYARIQDEYDTEDELAELVAKAALRHLQREQAEYNSSSSSPNGSLCRQKAEHRDCDEASELISEVDLDMDSYLDEDTLLEGIAVLDEMLLEEESLLEDSHVLKVEVVMDNSLLGNGNGIE